MQGVWREGASDPGGVIQSVVSVLLHNHRAMNSLFSIVPLAVVDSANVLALLAVSLVWVSSASRRAYARTAVSFMIGGICGLALTLVFSFTVILQLVHRALGSLSPAAVAVIVVVVALLVIGMAVRGFLRPPMSLPVHHDLPPVAAGALGLITWTVQSLTSAPFYGAIAVMADETIASRLGLSTVFVVIAVAPVAALVLALLLCPTEAGHRMLAHLQAALPMTSRVVAAILIVAAGAAAAIGLTVIFR